MSWELGQTATITITLDVFALDTAVTVVVTSPSGTVTAPIATPNVGHSVWTLTLPLTEAGDWSVVATVTGTGATEKSQVLHVADAPPAATGLYATTKDWADYYPGRVPPDGLATLLRRSARTVRGIVQCAVYDPTDTAIRSALREATIEQADYLAANGLDQGVPVGAQSVSIATVSISRGYSAAGGAANELPFSPIAFDILQAAGLTGWGPSS